MPPHKREKNVNHEFGFDALDLAAYHCVKILFEFLKMSQELFEFCSEVLNI
jgi:hypothetical protein